MPLVRVALPVPLFREFDYQYSPDQSVVVGARVVVPFGKRKMVGVVVALPDISPISRDQLKSVLTVLDKESLFSPPLWQLLKWGAGYYYAPLGEVLHHALPKKLRLGNPTPCAEKCTFHATLQGLQALASGKLKRAKKQQMALQACAKIGVDKTTQEVALSTWMTLKNKGWVEEKYTTTAPLLWQDALAGEPCVREGKTLSLNTEQALALGLLESTFTFQTWLLDGVTGSGKTEIYLQYISLFLHQHKQVLMLVPEINLTPQTVQRFRDRFRVKIDVWHSHLTDTERLKVWERVRSGQSAILIGTRSAIFIPFRHLGVIILDEEQDSSFKQQEGFRYHGRDLAVMYAKICNIPILLGSATPSLESLHNVEKGKYRSLTLKKRAGKSQPLHHFVIDMKKQPIKRGISQPLIKQIHRHLQAGNQVLVFLNRRGFAPVLLCHECSWVASCPQCDKPFTFYQKKRVLRCHHCGNQQPIPLHCEQCNATDLNPTGLGTEQLEESLSKLFPQYRITRIDRDSTARKGELETQLKTILQGKSQILVGTQMLAKGHHFPNVTLVALVDVDGALFSRDFRAEEYLAQLYTQVAGRAGRAGEQGEVVLQTHFADHPLLQTLLCRGYGEFAQQTLMTRHAIGLPPYSAQVLFKAQGKDSQEVYALLQRMSDYFHAQAIPDLAVLPPEEAPLMKKAGFYRWHLLLQHPQRSVLQHLLHHFPCEDFSHSQVKWRVDVDPLDFN